MNSSKLIILIAIIIATLFACNENEYTSTENLDHRTLHDHDFEHNLKSINLTSHYTPKEVEKMSEMRIKTPSFALQEEIYSELTLIDNWDTQKQILADHYGKIRWNWSYIEITSSTKYIVFIPVYNDNNLTAILSYVNNDTYNQFHFQSVNDIIEKTVDFTNMDVDTYTRIYVSALIRFQEIQFDKVYLKANNWLEVWGDENADAIIFKTPTTIGFPYEYWEYDGADVDSEGEFTSSLSGGSGRLVSGTTVIEIPCWERAPAIIQAPSGPSSGGITGKPTPPDPETKLRIKDKECEKHNMTSDAINCIRNSNLEFPCEEGDTDDVWDEIIESLCDDATDGQNTQLEGPNAGKIDCADVEIALSGYDWIEEDDSFIECENYKCVFDYLMNNSTGRYCSDMDQIFDSEDYGIVYQTHNSGADGEATYRSIENGSINISLHIADCEKTDLLFNAETLYHEGTHALFYQELLIDGLETNSTEAIQEAWAIYASENFDIPYQSQHIAMVYEYMDKAAEFLWELNGMQLSKDHYMKYVYDGLKEWFAFPPNDIENWNDKWNELNGNDPYITNYNTFSCN